MEEFELKYIVWSCTKACNFYCIHCAKDAGDPLPNELDSQEAKNLLSQIADFQVPLYIAGVEPLIRKDITEITSYGAQLGIDVYLKTNGWYLDDYMADQLSHDRVKVIIGMSGNKEVQERVRGKGSFQKAVDAAKRAARRGNLLGISIWLTKLTLDQIPELLDLAIDIGAEEFSLADYVPQGRTKEIYKKLMPSPQEYEKALIEIYYYYKELQNEITVFPYTIFSRRIMKTMEPDIVLNKACSLHDWLEVAEDGKVYPCRSMDLMIGDIRRDSLKTIWERLPDSETGELIRKLYRRENIRGKCGQCQFFNICGGCRARALSLTGDMFAADPACPYMPQEEKWVTI